MKALSAFLFMAVAVLGAPRNNITWSGPNEPSYRTCGGHYKDGSHCKSAVLPITNGHSHFRISCEIDDARANATITTVVQNTLQQPTKINGTMTVGYQVSDRDFLASLIGNSAYCQQTMTILWAPSATEGQFVGESANGASHVFSPNGNFVTRQTIDLLSLNMNGLFYFKNVSSKSVSWIQLSSLRCVERVDINEDCANASTAIRPNEDRSEFAGFAEMGFLHLRLPKVVSVAFNASPPAGQRVVKWWVYLRAPEDNWKFVKVISIGDFEIFTGENGGMIRVTNAKTNEQQDFFVYSPDVRLHLVTVKESPMTSSDGHNQTMKLSVQVDADVKLMSFHSLENTNITIHVQQAVDASAFGGCFAGVGFGYAIGNSSNVTSVSGNGLKIIEGGSSLQKNIAKEMSGDTFTGCGIFDPTLWTDWSSPIEVVGKYKPKNRYYLPVILLVVVGFLVVLAFICLVIIFLFSDNKERRIRVDSETQTADVNVPKCQEFSN